MKAYEYLLHYDSKSEDWQQNIVDIKECKLGWAFNELIEECEDGLIRVRLLFITCSRNIMGDK